MHALIEVLSGASPKHSPHPAMCFPEQLLICYLQLCSSGFKTLQWRKWDLLCEMRTNCGPFQQFGPHADQVRNCGPLRSHCIGRWGAWTWDGGGTTSEVLGSWKVRFNFAWPPGSDSRQKLACRPLFQKFATWENWWKATVWRWGEKWFGGAGGSCWALAGWAMNMEGRRYDFRGWGKLECEAHRGGPLAVSLLDGLVSKKKLLYGRTGGGRKHGRWGTKELGGSW